MSRAAIPFALFLFACGGTDEAAGGGAGSAGAPSAGGASSGGTSSGGASSGGSGGSSLPPLPPDLVLSQEIVIENVAPGEEDTVCIRQRLPNDRAVKVVELRGFIEDGSHHMIIDRPGGGSERTQPYSCGDLQGTDQSRMLIAQQHETQFILPEGVAYTLETEELITLEMHYINTTPNPITARGRVEFVLAPEEDFDSLTEAKMEFTGSPVIILPPRSQREVLHFQQIPGTPDNPTYVYALTSHTHRLGVRSTIERRVNAETPGEHLHESIDWAEPPLDRFEPPLVFTGGDGVFLRCEYDNTTDATVTFGTGFFDEMCFMWLYMY